ncbi:hypothetical protein GCM10022221_68590 [Actinocorallia aurea]
MDEFFKFKRPFLPAEPARIMIRGESGHGRTTAAHQIAQGLARSGTVGVIDTQNGHSAYLAKDYDFTLMTLPTFRPGHLRSALAAAAAEEFDVVIIDNGSAFYSGNGGVRSIVDKKGWNAVGDIQNAIVTMLCTMASHLVMTLDLKPVTSEVRDDQGVTSRVRTGTRGDFITGTEQHFHVVADLDETHALTVRKVYAGISAAAPGEHFAKAPVELGEKLAADLSSGTPLPTWRDIWDPFTGTLEGIRPAQVASARDRAHKKGLGGAVFTLDGQPTTLDDALRELHARLTHHRTPQEARAS